MGSEMGVRESNSLEIKNNEFSFEWSIKNKLGREIIVFIANERGLVLKSFFRKVSHLTPHLVPNLGVDRLSGSDWLKRIHVQGFHSFSARCEESCVDSLLRSVVACSVFLLFILELPAFYRSGYFYSREIISIAISY